MSENAPRLMSRQQAAEYVGLTYSGFGTWVVKGIIPPALRGTRRWDRNAIDQALDKLSGLERVNGFSGADRVDENKALADRWFREHGIE